MATTPFLPNAIQNKINPKYAVDNSAMLNVDPDTTPYAPLADVLGLLDENKPQKDEQELSRMRGVAKTNALAEALKLLAEGWVGGTTKADIPQRQPNPIALNALQQYRNLDMDYKNRLNQWTKDRTGVILRDAELKDRERVRQDENAAQQGRFDKEMTFRQNQADINNKQQDDALNQRKTEFKADQEYKSKVLNYKEEGSSRPTKPPYYNVRDKEANNIPIYSEGDLNDIRDMILDKFASGPVMNDIRLIQQKYSLQPERAVQEIVTKYWDKDPEIAKWVMKLAGYREQQSGQGSEPIKPNPLAQSFNPNTYNGLDAFNVGQKMKDIRNNPYVVMPENGVEAPRSVFSSQQDVDSEYSKILMKDAPEERWMGFYNLAVALGLNDEQARIYATNSSKKSYPE